MENGVYSPKLTNYHQTKTTKLNEKNWIERRVVKICPLLTTKWRCLTYTYKKTSQNKNSPALTIHKKRSDCRSPAAAEACRAVLWFSWGMVLFTLQPAAWTKTWATSFCFAAWNKFLGDPRHFLNWLWKKEKRIQVWKISKVECMCV